MERIFGYRLMQGKQGIKGHVRGNGQGEQLIIRGLKPGEACDIFILQEGQAGPLVSLMADGQGQIDYRSPLPGRYFVVSRGRVILWEDEGRQEENYLQACAALLRNSTANETGAKAEEENDYPEEEPDISPQEDIGVLLPPPPKEIPPEADVEETYALRPPGQGEDIDALPALIWPGEAKNIQIYFESLPPFAPFDLPGWRFVRAPSPVKECTYCALGYLARDGRVNQIVYALPGVPFHPPANLPGYTYQPGKNGQGYWVTVRKTEA